MSSPVFVTGGGGFIGGKLAARLRAEGRIVRLLARRPLPEFAQSGAEIVTGDLHDVEALRRGCAGAATVFHVAARVGVWGPSAEFQRVNVEGTAKLLAIAREAGVKNFVHTSSPSAVFNGCDLAGVDESVPLCTRAPCAYPTSKAAAERLVAAAHTPGFATVSLRPHLVWGPGDKNLVPRVVALARAGRLRIVGTGCNRVDLTHIDNVVDAHLLAESALTRCHLLSDNGSESTQGNCHLLSDNRGARQRAYFITNGEPVLLWDWINHLLGELGVTPVTRRVPVGLAAAVGGACELTWRAFRLRGEPPMTRFAAKELATDHWFDISAARRDLGYTPRITMAAGLSELLVHFRAAARG